MCVTDADVHIAPDGLRRVMTLVEEKQMGSCECLAALGTGWILGKNCTELLGVGSIHFHLQHAARALQAESLPGNTGPYRSSLIKSSRRTGRALRAWTSYYLEADF